MKQNTTKIIERGLLLATVIFAVIGVLTVFTNSSETKDELPPKNTTYNVKAIKTPMDVSFAGEQMPMANFDVREALDKELHKVCYWHSETFLYLKRANRYFPVIEKILKENNVPEDFKYLAIAESGLENVTSPAGAKGFWQFMKPTAKEYKLEVNSEVDERYHLEKSTKAACQYLKRAYRKFGSWTMAAAAYNTGEGNLERQVHKQGQTGYHDLLLNSETGRYVYRTVAIKLVLENPSYYRFNIETDDLYKPYDCKTVVLDSTVIDFEEYAGMNNTNYKVLKILNPWLRNNSLTNSKKKSYKIKLPVDGMRQELY